MKHYTKTIEEPRLVIKYDDNPQSPRDDSNLGYFITAERNYRSPDAINWLKDIINETGQEATSTEDHMDKIKKQIEETGEKVLAIYPVYKYEHSAVVYRRGTASGWDYSNCGFYIITDKTQKEVGTLKEIWEQVIDAELETYTKYANGEVYGFTLYDENGKEIDSCRGFYDIDDMKDYLPDEWKKENLHDYIKH